MADGERLALALRSARAGDLILLADGHYEGGWTIAASGTATWPIVLCGGRGAVLDAGSRSDRDVIALKGSYWVLSGFSLTNGLRGIYSERASHNVLQYLDIYNLGQEGIHWRVFSTHNVVRHTLVHVTGRENPEYGEGVYLGQYRGQWCQYTECEPDKSDSNLVIDNLIGPDVTAEMVDVKEGTTGGIIAGNVLDGRGMVRSQPWVDSWIEINGNGYIVSGNSGRTSPHDGFQVVIGLDGWGDDNVFVRNVADVEAAGYGFRIDPRARGTIVTCDNIEHHAEAGLTNIDCSNASLPASVLRAIQAAGDVPH